MLYQGDVTRERINDMVRDAEAYRRTRGTRAARAAERRASVRRIAAGAVSLVLWPLKH
jgi:hypothetical protein